MTLHLITIVGFALLFATAAGLVVVSRLWPASLATFSELVHHLMARPATRLLLFLAWAWLGWHLLAR